VNRLELIDELRKRARISKNDSRRVVDKFIDEMADALSKGKRVEIRGLCSFSIKKYKGFSGRNPKTGEMVKVKPKKLPFFKCGKDLRERVDGGK
jgi:integration host factor subunit beta